MSYKKNCPIKRGRADQTTAGGGVTRKKKNGQRMKANQKRKLNF